MSAKADLMREVERGFFPAGAGLRSACIAPDGRIVPGDVVVAVDGTPVDSADALGRALDGKRIGDRVTVRLWREEDGGGADGVGGAAGVTQGPLMFPRRTRYWGHSCTTGLALWWMSCR